MAKSLTQRVLSQLKDISKEQKVRKKGRYTAGYAVFSADNFERVAERLELVLKPVLKNGEKISSTGPGEIIDSGVKQFEILKGIFSEVYDYSTTTATFIRLYHISDGKREWLALYIDENPSTPWWGHED
jgi:hypothetical protein